MENKLKASYKNIRIHNARILTMKDNEKIFNGEVYIIGNKIEKVFDYSKNSLNDIENFKKECKDLIEIDADNNLIMPGFKNVHTHSAMTFLRSNADDMPLDKWLTEQIFPNEAKLKETHVYELSKLAILEYLTSGVTTIFDMYLNAGEMAKAGDEMGMRTVICGAVNDFDKDIYNLEKDYLKFKNYSDLVSFRMGFHAEYTTSEENLKIIADIAHKYQEPVYAHISETANEVQGCIERHGMPPVKYLDSLDMFKYGGGGFHLVHVNDEEIEILKKKNISVITNPASNMKLASGIAPLTDYVEKGVNVAIGTDGPASNNSLDMFKEMYLAAGLQKLRLNDASAMQVMEVLKMATVGGAKALNMEDCCYLSEGSKADIIMIDLDRPNMHPINNIEKNIVYAGDRSNIKMTMINGKVLYYNYRFYTAENYKNIYENANRIFKEIVG